MLLWLKTMLGSFYSLQHCLTLTHHSVSFQCSLPVIHFHWAKKERNRGNKGSLLTKLCPTKPFFFNGRRKEDKEESWGMTLRFSMECLHLLHKVYHLIDEDCSRSISIWIINLLLVQLVGSGTTKHIIYFYSDSLDIASYFATLSKLLMMAKHTTIENPGSEHAHPSVVQICQLTVTVCLPCGVSLALGGKQGFSHASNVCWFGLLKGKLYQGSKKRNWRNQDLLERLTWNIVSQLSSTLSYSSQLLFLPPKQICQM